MPDRQTIITQLKELGRGQLENFNMSEPQRKANAKTGALPVAGYSPDNGYCHGVCVDWIRRVLQGGRPRFGPNPEKNAKASYDYHTRRQGQAKRQGYAWASFDKITNHYIDLANVQKQSNKAAYDQAYDKYVNDYQLMSDVYQQLISDYNDHMYLGEAHQVQIGYGAKLQKIFPQLKTPPAVLTVLQLDQLSERVLERHNALEAPVQATAPSLSDTHKSSFAAFTKNIDAKFPKKRKFGGIALLQKSPMKQYGSLLAAIEDVTNPAPTDFSIGRAMTLGFGMQNGNEDSGHAVALYWHPGDFFILLDPNYGMFIYERLAGAKSVGSALSYLFGTAYPEPGVVVTNGVDYEIYAKRDA
ncbi:hypothetical protein [Paraburkholderia sp. EG304]|uniref:hypothetical protein n=1 Tax=Paraburkholderia sp. EG304 TaxID=3237015 RepID=UPI00397CA045